jgi:predicted phage tail protein
VSWTAPPDGGSSITGYVVVAYVGFASVRTSIVMSAATTRTIVGLTNGTTYRFRVRAINSVGVGDPSKASNAITPRAPTVPDSPTVGTAAAGDRQATVEWTAPSSDGGATIAAYLVTPYVGYWPLPAQVFSSASRSGTVSGLTNGVTYRFRVQAVNAVGNSAYSKVTNPITPSA